MLKEKHTHRIQIKTDDLSDKKLIELLDFFSLQEIDFDYGSIDLDLRKMTKQKLRESENNLKERVKEFNCLYGISKVIETPEIPILEIFQAIIDLILSAFQFPESACVKIDYNNNVCQTENFQETEWCISHNLIINDKNFLITVYYLEDLSFLEEEIHLLGEIANRLKIVIAKKIAEQKLIESEGKMRDLLDTAPIGVLDINLKTMDVDYINPKLLNIVGYDLDELNKKEIILSNFDISNNKNLEFKFYDKQKNLRWLSGAKVCQHDDSGGLKSVRIWVHDIISA